MSTPPPQINAVTHTQRTEWGKGLVVRDTPEKVAVVFENYPTEILIARKYVGAMLAGAVATPDELEALQSRASGRKPRSATTAAKMKAAAKKRANAGKKVAPRYPSFAEQLAAFDARYPGGFMGEAFIKEERGVAGAPDKKGKSKETAIATARESLSPAGLAKSDDEVFAVARALLASTNMVFPIEGPIPFGQLEGDERASAMKALRDLIQGTGDYGDRLEKFANAVKLKDSDGKAKKVTWPLATVFGALYTPAENVFIKPSFLTAQAEMLGEKLNNTQLVSANAYNQFKRTVEKTRDLLVQAGQSPRDLLDVYGFIYRTREGKAQPKEIIAGTGHIPPTE